MKPPKYAQVVADTSPLISLEKITASYSLLRSLCSSLLLPSSVQDEITLLDSRPDDYWDRHRVRLFTRLEIVESRSLDDVAERLALPSSFGVGEYYAIALAFDRQVPVLAEERLARATARRLGLKVFGAAGIVKIAFERGTLDRKSAERCLVELLEAHRINRRVFRRVCSSLVEENQA